ncbi:nucleoside-diphosphate-sugar epimerase [Desulfosporosinus orientis DSM 765]|uniref:Nucleoside-diphosphate-sugar epimerase n=1 Tax=Desulfosporosinus orientis (strain ATCC 19365 / DSM 765 / NCIMB 8382 / VKM B-1628 / Singapore I) TaxID=768706 RepID=G7W770_DESOD|nr:NAD(P)-dependent oxidoreductase [Desulfosporosinus orientis]AET70578.1 nucleoside-diphosphate-sugar epimerase [Desulfosporosinus orientis DSM 765]
MNYILFGGTGFIGTNLINLIKTSSLKPEDKIYALDIVMPGEEGVVPGIVEKFEGVIYVRLDVRQPIEFNFNSTEKDIIFNLAAVHRTPGHPDYAYFETNIKGAENVTAFADRNGIKRILFTSSIAPYGAAEELKCEDTLPTPNTAYGISKLVAEKIHAIWQAKDESRCLTIVRPGVVFGKGEHGNFTRMYKGIKNRYFFYAGRTDTIKASIYVKELAEFIKYRMIDNDFTGVGLYNCTYEPAFTVKQSCEAIKKATGLKRKTLVIPSWILMIASVVLYPFGGKKLGLHPARVKKLEVSTNISGKKLAASGYKLKYSLDEALLDWFEDCGREKLE